MIKASSQGAALGIQRRVKMRKYQGDDLYSWAVFVDNFPKWTGMSRSEASWRKDVETWKLIVDNARATVRDRLRNYTDMDWTCLAQSIALEWQVDEAKLLNSLRDTFEGETANGT